MISEASGRNGQFGISPVCLCLWSSFRALLRFRTRPRTRALYRLSRARRRPPWQASFPRYSRSRLGFPRPRNVLVWMDCFRCDWRSRNRPFRGAFARSPMLVLGMVCVRGSSTSNDRVRLSHNTLVSPLDEISAVGPSRHLLRLHRGGRCRDEADITDNFMSARPSQQLIGPRGLPLILTCEKVDTRPFRGAA